jgi:hypothetical protein
MKAALHRGLTAALGIALFTLLQGCGAGGGAYYDGGGGVDVVYGADYYEPWGYEYGGWGPGYRVGPPRGGYPHPHEGGGGRAAPAYHPAAPSRSMPSIPRGSRSR